MRLAGQHETGFQLPELARIFFWHFPCAITTTLCLFAGAWHSYRYLSRGQAVDDVRATAAIELAMMFSLLVMATGIIFSKVQWGAWWQQDPRVRSSDWTSPAPISNGSVRLKR